MGGLVGSPQGLAVQLKYSSFSLFFFKKITADLGTVGVKVNPLIGVPRCGCYQGLENQLDALINSNMSLVHTLLHKLL